MPAVKDTKSRVSIAILAEEAHRATVGFALNSR